MLRFVDVTPVGRWTGRALAGATATGSAELKLALAIPLTRPTETVVKGSGRARRQRHPHDRRHAVARRCQGPRRFLAARLHRHGGSARVLGGDIGFEGGSSAGLSGGDTQRFSGRGTVTAEAMRQSPELGTLARMRRPTGQTQYRATLAFVNGRPQISVASNLVGVAVDLPAPLAKAAATPLALRYRTGPKKARRRVEPGAPMRETLQVDLGGGLQANFLRESQRRDDPRRSRRDRVAEARAERRSRRRADAARSDRGPALPAQGVAAYVALKRLDVEAWQAALARMQGDGARPGAVAAAPLVFDASGGAGYVPDAIALRVGELVSAARRSATSPRACRSKPSSGAPTSAPTSSRAMSNTGRRGAARPAPAGSTGASPVSACPRARSSASKGCSMRSRRRSRRSTSSSTTSSCAAAASAGSRSRRPTGPRATDAGREWQLAKLNLTMPEAQLSASGTWGDAGASAANPARRAAMNFNLALGDSGALLERLGMGRVVRGGKGSLAGEVSWPGSPFSPDYAKMTGQVKVAIDSGQFLKAGPGAARLLSVLSLQSLPRRLSFDFRDLFSEGFAFDNVVGDVRIGHGRRATNNLRMRGPAAAVLMEGSADLEHETEDLRVVVVPEINAGTASLAYAVINPAIGLGTFLAQYFLRKPLMAASTREFRVTGPWDDPKVERVERSLAGEGAADPAPTVDPAPTARDRRGATMKIAAVQMVSTPNVETNLEAARRLVGRAAGEGAELVVLPEYFCFMGKSDRDKLAVAEAPGDGPIQRMLAESAREHGVWLIGGTLPLAIDGRATPARRCRVMNANLRLLAARRPGGALRQDAPVRVRQRPRALRRGADAARRRTPVASTPAGCASG